MPERPPKKWFVKMRREIDRQPRYRHYSSERKDRIVAGIWHNYDEDTQRRLTKKYEGNPDDHDPIKMAIARRIEKGDTEGTADVMVEGVPVHVTWKAKGAR